MLFFFFSGNDLKEGGGKCIGDGLAKLINLTTLTLYLR